MNRRNVLIGFGGVVAGGGALIGTGAFDTVEAQRDVTVETEGDANAFLGLAPARNELDELSGADFVDASQDGTIEITIDDSEGDDDIGSGLNQSAITTFDHLVLVTNQGSQTVDEITLEFTETPANVEANETFAFPVSNLNQDGDGIGDGPDTLEHDGAVDILGGSGDTPEDLSPGDSVVFGLEIDLLEGGDDNDLPTDGDYTLTITAESEDDE